MAVTVTKPCGTCGEIISGAPQRRYCPPCRAGRYRATVRWLSPGEKIPANEPGRYRSSHGYIRLRWRTGKRAYLETYEHRVGLDGFVVTNDHVHHVNLDRTDNRPENLRPLSAAEHHALHGNCRWWFEAAAMYRSGLSTYQVGKRLRHDPSTVYRALVKLSVPLRKEARIAIPHCERNHR